MGYSTGLSMNGEITGKLQAEWYDTKLNTTWKSKNVLVDIGVPCGDSGKVWVGTSTFGTSFIPNYVPDIVSWAPSPITYTYIPEITENGLRVRNKNKTYPKLEKYIESLN